MGRAQRPAQSTASGFESVFGTRRGKGSSSRLTAAEPSKTAEAYLQRLCSAISEDDYQGAVSELVSAQRLPTQPPLIEALEHALSDHLITKVSRVRISVARAHLVETGLIADEDDEEAQYQPGNAFPTPRRGSNHRQSEFSVDSRRACTMHLRELFWYDEEPSKKDLVSCAVDGFWQGWSKQAAKMASDEPHNALEGILGKLYVKRLAETQAREAVGNALTPDDWRLVYEPYASDQNRLSGSKAARQQMVHRTDRLLRDRLAAQPANA